MRTQHGLGRRHLWALDQDLEERHQEGVVDDLAALLHHVHADVDTGTGLQRMHDLVALVIDAAIVQRTRTKIKGLQRAVFLQQQRWIDDFVSSPHHGLAHLVEHLDVRQNGHRRRAAIDLFGSSDVAPDSVRHGTVATFTQDGAAIECEIARVPGHALVVFLG